MNSIRLSRFNAFLYRVNNSFPDEELACQVIHASMLAMLSNDRNFVEEDGKK
jgi:predicted lactoylglutathione lyase